MNEELNRTIYKYIRKNKNILKGVLVATRPPNTDIINFGYSVVNLSSNDKFDKEKGKTIALTRSTYLSAPRENTIIIPKTVYKELYEFINRSLKYFKGCTVPQWAKNIVDNDIPGFFKKEFICAPVLGYYSDKIEVSTSTANIPPIEVKSDEVND